MSVRPSPRFAPGRPPQVSPAGVRSPHAAGRRTTSHSGWFAHEHVKDVLADDGVCRCDRPKGCLWPRHAEEAAA